MKCVTQHHDLPVAVPPVFLIVAQAHACIVKKKTNAESSSRCRASSGSTLVCSRSESESNLRQEALKQFSSLGVTTLLLQTKAS